MIDPLQDVLTRRPLSTAYRIRSEVRDGYNVFKVTCDEYKMQELQKPEVNSCDGWGNNNNNVG